jgi:hypothetical protein
MVVLDEPFERPLLIEERDQRGGRDPAVCFALEALPRFLEQLLDPSGDARRKARDMASDAAGHLDALVGGLSVAIATGLRPCRE